jgi:hypothetical protein
MDSAPGPSPSVPLPSVPSPSVPLAVESVIDTRNISTYKIIAIVVIFLIVASVVYYAKDYIYSEWRKLFPVNELTGESELISNVTSSTPAVLNYSNVAPGALPSAPTLPSAVESVMSVLEPAKSESAFGETAASSEQTWCLVGEDMAGRWCLQVQSPAGCEPSRTYKTKNQCERSNDPVPE